MEDMKRKKTEVVPGLNEEILDQLISQIKPGDQEALLGKNGLLGGIVKRLMEKALQAEMDHHLGYQSGDKAPETQEDRRNGKSAKQVEGEFGKMILDMPRDRDGDFEPVLIKKHQRRLSGLDEKIIGLYARGMTVREIKAFLEEQYGAEVSPDLISRVTDAVMEEVQAWQNRPLDRMYPLVFMDAMKVKIRDGQSGQVHNKSVYLALAVRTDGTREVLGLWIDLNEGAKFWQRIVNELKNRGVEDILIAIVDGLKGFPEAIANVYPQTQVQTCVVHLIRNSLEYVSWKERKEVAAALKAIYTAPSASAAYSELETFQQGPWGKKFPPIAPIWKRVWEYVIPFFDYPPEVRKIIYTTNAIESLNRQMRKSIKIRGHFPTDEAALKLMYLTLKNISKKWTMPIREWNAAKNQFAVMFPERFNPSTLLKD